MNTVVFKATEGLQQHVAPPYQAHLETRLLSKDRHEAPVASRAAALSVHLTLDRDSNFHLSHVHKKDLGWPLSNSSH